MKLFLAASLTFLWGEKEFVVIEDVYPASFATTPHGWVPTSLYAHEILLIDPCSYPLLLSSYEKFKSILANIPSQNLFSILSVMSTYLHTEVFTISHNRKQTIRDEIALQKCPCLPLDFFIAKRIGVCRHYVLMAAYLLAQLQVDEAFIFPKICIVRQNLSSGRHAWLQIGEWHFDPYWNLILNLNNPADKEFLHRLYK